jgi:hypothetical protein
MSFSLLISKPTPAGGCCQLKKRTLAIIVDRRQNLAYFLTMQIVTRTEINDMIFQKKGDLSLRAYALTVGLSASYLSDLLRGNREPGPRLLKFLKLRKRKVTKVTYERIALRKAGR